jgi:hypothetical protein
LRATKLQDMVGTLANAMQHQAEKMLTSQSGMREDCHAMYNKYCKGHRDTWDVIAKRAYVLTKAAEKVSVTGWVACQRCRCGVA